MRWWEFRGRASRAPTRSAPPSRTCAQRRRSCRNSGQRCSWKRSIRSTCLAISRTRWTGRQRSWRRREPRRCDCSSTSTTWGWRARTCARRCADTKRSSRTCRSRTCPAGTSPRRGSSRSASSSWTWTSWATEEASASSSGRGEVWTKPWHGSLARTAHRDLGTQYATPRANLGWSRHSWHGLRIVSPDLFESFQRVLAGRPRRKDAVVHLEVGPVVLGEDHVHGGARNAQGTFQLVDGREREAAFLVRRAAAPQVRIEEGDSLGGVLRADPREGSARATPAPDGDVVGAGIHHPREVLDDGRSEVGLLFGRRREAQVELQMRHGSTLRSSSASAAPSG